MQPEVVCVCVCVHTFFILPISSHLASLWFFLLHIETQLKAPNPFSSDWDKSRLVEWVARRPNISVIYDLAGCENKYRFIELSGTLFEFSALAVLFHLCLLQCFPLSLSSPFLPHKCEHIGPYNSFSSNLLIPQSYYYTAFSHSIVSWLTRHSKSSVSKSWSF